MFYMNSVMPNQAEQQKSLLLVSHNTEKNTWKDSQEQGLYIK